MDSLFTATAPTADILTKSQRISTVPMLDGTNDAYTALYVIDSAAAHVSHDDAAFMLLLTHHSQMSQEYDATTSHESQRENATHVVTNLS